MTAKMCEETVHRRRMIFQMNDRCFDDVDDVARDVCPSKKAGDYDVKIEVHPGCKLARAQFLIEANAGVSLWRFDKVTVKLNVKTSDPFLYGWRLMVLDEKTRALTPAFCRKVPITWAGVADVTRRKVTAEETVDRDVRTAWKDDYHGALTNETRCDEARPDLMGETKIQNVCMAFGAPLVKHLAEREFRVSLDDFRNVDRERSALLLPRRREENLEERVRYMKDEGFGDDDVAAARFENCVGEALRTCGRSLMLVCDRKHFDRDDFKSTKTDYVVPFPIVEALVSIAESLHSQSNYVLMTGKSLVLELDRFSGPSTGSGSVELVVEYVTDLVVQPNRPWSVDYLIENELLNLPRTVADIFANGLDDDDDEHEHDSRGQRRAHDLGNRDRPVRGGVGDRRPPTDPDRRPKHDVGDIDRKRIHRDR